MSNPDMGDNAPSWPARIATPFRVLFNEGFLAAWHKHTLFSLVSLSLLGIALVTALWWFVLRDAAPDNRLADAWEDPKSASEDIEKAESPDDLEAIAERLRLDEERWRLLQEESKRQEEIALAKYRLACVRQTAARTKEAIDACRDEAAEWDEDMKDLANARINWNDEANQGLLGRVDVLLSLGTPDKLQAEELLDRHEALVAPLDRAESLGEPSTVSDDLETRVKELGEDARTMQKLYQRRRAMLRSIRDLARTSPQGDLPDLHTALADYRAAQATTQQARIDEQLAKVSEENEAVIRKAEEAAAAALVEAKREAAEIRGQIEADRVASEAKRDKTLQEVADTEAQLATDREKLEREFEMDLPKIQHYLQAFITPDNYHPVKKTTVEKMPFPYSYLESRGVLAPTEEGMQRLCEMASTGVGARPRGPIPYVATSTEWRNASTQQHDTIVTAQQLLRKYGLLMVEKKMLLP